MVDDEPDTRYLLSSVLRNEGYEVETAVDGTQAVSLISNRKPSLVLLDWRLPGANGAQVAREMRTFHPDLSFMVVTADGQASAKAEQIQTPWYLHKPFEIEELVSLVSEALAGA